MMHRTLRSVRALAGLAALAALAACATETVSGPTRTAGFTTFESTGANAVLPTDSWFPLAGTVKVCNFDTPGSTFTASATGGTLLASSFTIAGVEECVIVWQAPAGFTGPAQVTVTETPAGGSQPFSIRVLASDADVIFLDGPNTATVTMTGARGVSMWFKNEPFSPPPPPPPPPPGSEGCTPGYWKQQQHFGNWTAPYTPTTAFGSVFANAFPGMSLLQVLGQGGGGIKALGRHTVAALLNTASTSVNYGSATPADIIAQFNAAYAAGEPAITNLKNQLATMNERGCPLARAE